MGMHCHRDANIIVTGAPIDEQNRLAFIDTVKSVSLTLVKGLNDCLTSFKGRLNLNNLQHFGVLP